MFCKYFLPFCRLSFYFLESPLVGGVAGCVSWQCNATGWILWLDNLSWWSENLGCASQPDGAAGWTLRSVMATGCALKLGRDIDWSLWSSRPLTVLCFGVRSQSVHSDLMGPSAVPTVGWLDCTQWLGRVTVQLPGWVGPEDRLCKWPGSLAGLLTGQGCRLCSPNGLALVLGSSVRWGCRLGSVAERYLKLGFKSAQGHCSSSLVVWVQRLGSTVG